MQGSSPAPQCSTQKQSIQHNKCKDLLQLLNDHHRPSQSNTKASHMQGSSPAPQWSPHGICKISIEPATFKDISNKTISTNPRVPLIDHGQSHAFYISVSQVNNMCVFGPISFIHTSDMCSDNCLQVCQVNNKYVFGTYLSFTQVTCARTMLASLPRQQHVCGCSHIHCQNPWSQLLLNVTCALTCALTLKSVASVASLSNSFCLPPHSCVHQDVALNGQAIACLGT